MDEEHRSLNDDLFDAAIKEALRKLARERELEAEQLLDSLREEARQIVPSRKFQNNIKYLCARAGKRKAPARIYPRALRMAAAVALVACVSATAVTVGVNADWDSLFGWSMEQTPVATILEKNVKLQELCSEELFMDTDLDYFYFPSYLPSNYQLADIEGSSPIKQIFLENSQHTDQKISIELIPPLGGFDFSATFDTEDTKGFTRITLGKYDCYYLIKNHKNPDTNVKIKTVDVICKTGDFWIIVSSTNLHEKELFAIMESMEKVERK